MIDLRGNPGGAGDLAPMIANLLSPGAGSLGTLTFRYAKQDYSYQGASDKASRGRVVVLVDERSASTSEVFSGGLQENGRATIIGETTVRAVLSSTMQLFPTGGALQHVISNFQTPKGIVLEGRGVIPNITVKITRSRRFARRS